MIVKYSRIAHFALAVVFVVQAVGRSSPGQQTVGNLPLNRANHSAVFRPFVETSFLVGGSTDRGESAVFLPIISDDRTLLFADSRGSLGDTGFQEGNWALAFRRLTDGGKVIGAWAGYDLRGTKWGHRFHQVSLGFEWLDEEWDFRLNGYIPTNLTPTDTPLSPGQLVVANNIVIESDRESALWGLDAELGRRLWHRLAIVDSGGDGMAGKVRRRRGLSGVLSRLNTVEAEFRGFVGGYYFDNSSAGVTKVAGPRIRSELRLYDLEMFGAGSRLTMEGIFQKDSVRGAEFEFGCYLRVPFGALPTRRFRPLERRMADRIVRDRDIVTSVGSVAEQVEVVGSGLKVGPVVRVDSATSSVAQSIRDAGPGSLVIIDNQGELYTKHSDTIELQPGQVVAGGGAELQFRGVETGLTQKLKLPGGRPTLWSEGITAVRATAPSQLIGLNFWLDRPTAVAIQALQNAELQLDDVHVVHQMQGTYSILLDAHDQARVTINDSVLDTISFRGIGIRLADDAQVFMNNSSLVILSGFGDTDDTDVLAYAAAYDNGRLSISNGTILLKSSRKTWFQFFDNSQLSFDQVVIDSLDSPLMEFHDSSRLIAHGLTLPGNNGFEHTLLRASGDSQIRIFDSYFDFDLLGVGFAFQDRARVMISNTTLVAARNRGVVTVEDSAAIRMLNSRSPEGALSVSGDATAVVDGSYTSVSGFGNSRILIRDSNIRLNLAGASRSYVENSALTLEARDDAIASIVESQVPRLIGSHDVEFRIRNSLVGNPDLTIFPSLFPGGAFTPGVGMSGNSRLSVDDSIVAHGEIGRVFFSDQSQGTIRNTTMDNQIVSVIDDASLTYENVRHRGGLVEAANRGYFRAESSELNGRLDMYEFGISQGPVTEILNSRITSDGEQNAILLGNVGQLSLRNSIVTAYSTDMAAIRSSGASILIENSTVENHSRGAAIQLYSFNDVASTISNSSVTSDQGTGIAITTTGGERVQILDSEVVSHGTAVDIGIGGSTASRQPASVILDGNRLTSYNSSVPEIGVDANSLIQGNCLSISDTVFGRGPGLIRLDNQNPTAPLLISQSRPSDNTDNTNALNRVNGIPAGNVIFEEGDLIFDSGCDD